MQAGRKRDAPRLARPAARYYKGRAPKGVSEAAQDSDSEYDEEAEQQQPEDVPIGDVSADEEEEEEDNDLVVQQQRTETKKSMNVALRSVNISKEGKVVVDGREESGRTAMEQAEEEEESEEEEVKAGKEEGTDSSEYETDSEEEEEVKPVTMFRPVFVPKRARVTIAEREAELADSEEAIKKREKELEERKKQSHDMVAESIRRELVEKEAEEHIPEIDDTDGLDPDAEFEAWRLRELARIKRDKEAVIRREEERAEIERRRALPEEVRLKEDLERAQQTREEKPKGQQKFLQKYWHKGAFHQDLDILKRHDYTEATESTVDISMLPKVMQVRDFGKRSRTKYTHLVDQDTTAGNGGFGGAAPLKAAAAGQGCFNCGGPHIKKDCPQLLNKKPDGPSTGANRMGKSDYRSNDAPRWDTRDERESRPSHDRDRDGREYRRYDRARDRSPRRDSDRRGDYYRPRSRSRSRESDRRTTRRRSRSRSVGRERDKRRRVD
ncbi:hypothetical protein M422DRAFT_29947 [Sphaerobolus stellatus SS14]|uniref:Micro-fibrillar-associated protein 1 C-terminal domain-containing protein n=1 Tax=Sphaerobolus stellatus (strain SS14) TaxID=990650 RepID=A0A0C9W284_SPHS4|nr:hypothetical protein M422DRAFT_29947 [Sphaerobolus stellatus SS14]